MCLTVRDSVRGNKDPQPIRELFLLLFLRCGLPRVRYTCSPEAKSSAHWKLDNCTDRILNIAILGQPCEGLRSDCSTASARTSVLAVDSPNNHVTGLVLDRYSLHRTLAILSCQEVVLPSTFLDLMALLKCFAGQISPTRHPVQKHRLCIISLFLINRAGLQPKNGVMFAILTLKMTFFVFKHNHHQEEIILIFANFQGPFISYVKEN